MLFSSGFWLVFYKAGVGSVPLKRIRILKTKLKRVRIHNTANNVFVQFVEQSEGNRAAGPGLHGLIEPVLPLRDIQGTPGFLLVGAIQ